MRPRRLERPTLGGLFYFHRSYVSSQWRDLVLQLTLLLLALLPVQSSLSSWVLRAEDGTRVVVDTNVKCEFPVTTPIPYTLPLEWQSESFKKSR